MSVGRQLAKELVDTAAALRRYASLMDDFSTEEAEDIKQTALANARCLEALVPGLLAFEGEHMTALPRVAS